MMKTTKTNKWQCLKALVMLPVAACAVVAFASPAVERTTMDIERETESALESLENVASVVSEKVSTQHAKITESDDAVTTLADDTLKTSDPNTVKDKPKVYRVVEEMPIFPGGQEEMFKFLMSNIRYPAEAISKNVQGRVIVRFVVDKDGSVIAPEVVRSVDPDLDKEAVRVILSMPKWMPGKQNGKPVAVYFSVPIMFRLNGGGDNKVEDSKAKVEGSNVINQVSVVSYGKSATKETKEDDNYLRTKYVPNSNAFYVLDGKNVDASALRINYAIYFITI